MKKKSRTCEKCVSATVFLWAEETCATYTFSYNVNISLTFKKCFREEKCLAGIFTDNIKYINFTQIIEMKFGGMTECLHFGQFYQRFIP